jgi:hypothetical protein
MEFLRAGRHFFFLLSQIRLMQNVLHRKTFDIFSDLNWKDNKTLICNISRERRKKKRCGM